VVVWWRGGVVVVAATPNYLRQGLPRESLGKYQKSEGKK